jgi:pyridoxal biosynthesis lyase PdxS
MQELDGRIVLAGVSTCTVAEQAKVAEQAGAAALLVSPQRISHDVPGA